jgi:tetratricopeptide (TPR) repeat protein/ferredoxin
VLIGVHVLIALHIAHWQIAGRTLAPLEVNEVLYTLHLGIVTAGFVFMALILVSVVIFGRFFCSWGCHLLALEDLSAWILRKAGIRPRPLRSRALMAVPMGAMLYLFVWPQVGRLVAGEPLPRLRILGDGDGWASFVTTDFWRNLPGPVIATATLVICGGVLIYLLGTRAFCNYGCPYGALFRLADRLAPGRILARGDCDACGICTASCTSGVRVHEEVEKFGMVLDPACLKDLDCVTACPKDVLRYGFVRPVPLRRRGEVRRRLDLTRGEEIVVALAFLGALLIFRGLYAAVPMLLAIGVAVGLAAVVVTSLRLLRGRRAWLGPLILSRNGRITRSGQVFAACAVLIGVFTLHSAVVRYHEYRGHRAFETAPRDPDRAAESLHHLEWAAAIGLHVPTDLHRRLASLYLLQGRDAEAAGHLTAVLSAAPGDVDARLRLGMALLRSGRHEEAAASLREVADDEHGPAAARATAGAHLAHLVAADDPHSAVILLERSVSLRPEASELKVRLGVLLGRLGRLEEAAAHLRDAIAQDPESAPAHLNLGAVLQWMERTDEAKAAYLAAVHLDPGMAAAWSNLGVIFIEARQWEEASVAFERVLRLNPDDPIALRTLSLIARIRGDGGGADRQERPRVVPGK